MRKKLLFLLMFSMTWLCSLSQNENTVVNDSIELLIDKAGNDAYTLPVRLQYAQRAKEMAGTAKNDTLYNKALRELAVNYLRQKEYNLFKAASKEFLNQSVKIKDSMSIAKANTYLGDFYRLASQSDSGYFYYYNAEKIYKELKDDLNTAKVLLRRAIIQKNEKDFIGSEVTSIEGIALLEPLNKPKTLSFFYNNLGIIYNELGHYEQAIYYHKKSIELKQSLKTRDLYLEESSYNNIAVVYKNAKRYDKALEYFNLILQNKKTRQDTPSFYAMVMDNYAHTKFLKNETSELPDLYMEALKICKSVDDQYNAIAINIHLSEYFNSIEKMDSARYYAHKAKDLAKKFHNDDYLKALLNLSEIEDDSLSVKYYEEYIALSDSLIDNERKIRNKFARIRYETKEIEERNKQITKERLYLIILSIGLLVTIFLTYIIISQRAKNKELRLNQLQQEANEEIYNLMLTQQEKIKEGRAQEKRRISEELHDGILGKLFGVRLSLDSLNHNHTEKATKSRSNYIEELKLIEQEIRQISHDLNTDFVSGSEYFEIIEALIETQTQAYSLNYTLKKDDGINWDAVSNKTKINLYRIIQESLQNIYKHANAKNVSVKFALEADFISLEIKDDGLGFDVDKAKKGIGIKNIRSRIKEINGQVSIRSTKQEGTTIKIKVHQ